MSPEQVSGGEIDARSDLFSVGILLAEMVMARRLFTSTNDLDILLMVRDARLDRLHKYASRVPRRAARADRARAAAPARGSLAERRAVPRRARRVDPAHDARRRRASSRALIGQRDQRADRGARRRGRTTEPDDASALSGPMTRMSHGAGGGRGRARARRVHRRRRDPDGRARRATARAASIDRAATTTSRPSTVDVPSGPREVGDLREHAGAARRLPAREDAAAPACSRSRAAPACSRRRTSSRASRSSSTRTSRASGSGTS